MHTVLGPDHLSAPPSPRLLVDKVGRDKHEGEEGQGDEALPDLYLPRRDDLHPQVLHVHALECNCPHLPLQSKQ